MGKHKQIGLVAILCLVGLLAQAATTLLRTTAGTTIISRARPSYPFDSQLLYYWSFDGDKSTWESSSQWFADASYPNNNATNRMIWSPSTRSSDAIEGAIGQGFLDNSTLGRVTNVNVTNVTLMTVSLWCKPRNIIGSLNGDRMIIEGGASNWTLQTNSVLIDSGNGSYQCLLGIRDGANSGLFRRDQFRITNVMTTSNLWYHMAVVFDATVSTGKIKCYVNSNPITLSNETSTATACRSFGNHQWSIGNRGSGSLSWPGGLDEIRIYSNELTQAQISLLYTSRFSIMQ